VAVAMVVSDGGFSAIYLLDLLVKFFSSPISKVLPLLPSLLPPSSSIFQQQPSAPIPTFSFLKPHHSPLLMVT